MSEKREGMSEREREIIEKKTLIVKRELKVSCFSSKKQENKNSTIVKQKKKLVGLSKMRCNLFLTSKGNDKPSNTNTHTQTQ